MKKSINKYHTKRAPQQERCLSIGELLIDEFGIGKIHFDCLLSEAAGIIFLQVE